MRNISLLGLALFLTQCGVEAGNTGKGRSGQLKVMVAQESSASGESLSVAVNSLSLLDQSDSEALSLTPSVSEVDLYHASASEGLLLAESDVVPSGTYAKIAIRLKNDKPIRYRDGKGKDHDVKLEDDSQSSLFIVQDIEIIEGKTTTIVLNLDPYQSLSKEDGSDRFVFKPRGEVSRHGDDTRYKGETNITRAEWICLYAYGPLEGPAPIGPPKVSDRYDDDKDGDEGRSPGDVDGFDDGRGPRGPQSLKGPGPRPGQEIKGRPSVGTKDELVRDTNSECSNAFAKTMIKDGKFEFRYLRHGTYAGRIFTSDGKYEDLSEDIVIKPLK